MSKPKSDAVLFMSRFKMISMPHPLLRQCKDVLSNAGGVIIGTLTSEGGDPVVLCL